MAKTQLVDLVSLNKIYSNLISNLGAKFNTLTTNYTNADTTLKNNLEGQLKTTNNTVSALDVATVKLAGTQTIKATNTFTGKNTFSGTGNSFTTAVTFSGNNEFTGANTFKTGTNKFESPVSFTKDTNSNSTSSGAVTISGGLGVAKTIYADAINTTKDIEAKGNITGAKLFYGDDDVKTYINSQITSALVSTFKYKGQVENYSALLKITSPSVGDVYNITKDEESYKYAGHNFVWSGTNDTGIGWDDLGDSATDFNEYDTKIKSYISSSITNALSDYSGTQNVVTLGNGDTPVTTAKFFGNNCIWDGAVISQGKHYTPSTTITKNGTVGTSSETTRSLKYSDTFTIPSFSYDKLGHIITIGDGTEYQLPASDNTDYQCTNEGHYAPQADSSSTLSAVATSTESATWADTSAVTAVSLQRDDKGHVTGLNVMSRKFKFDNISTDVAFTSTTESNAVDEGAITISGGLGVAGNIYGSAVYNAVWNDIADCIEVDCELTAGYCYSFDGEHYYRTTEYMDGGCIGIHSDTAGMHVGSKGGNEMEVAIGGFVLAYVDKEYKVGTPLTCTEGGMLTEIKLEDKRDYPERIIATYWKNEPNEEWGSDTRKVKVNGRKWVKIK